MSVEPPRKKAPSRRKVSGHDQTAAARAAAAEARKTRAPGRVIPPPYKKPTNVEKEVPDRMRALLDGRLKIEDLDKEELVRGRLRAKDGTFSGRPSNLVPREFHTAITNELVRRVEGGLRSDLETAYGVLKSVATNPHAAAVARNQAAIYLIERLSGKIENKTAITAEVKSWEKDMTELVADLATEEDQ